MSVYSDTQIKAGLESGQINIYPLVPQHIRTNSVDIRAGEWFFRPGFTEPGRLFNPYSAADVAEYYGQPLQAPTHYDWCAEHGCKLLEGIDPQERIIVLAAGERILLESEEFLGIEPPGTFMLKCRSSWGRFLVEPWGSTGWGDSGFYGKLGMPLHNTGQHPIVIKAGERIAQVVFMLTGSVERHYGNIGQYSGRQSREQIRAQWQPRMIVPNSPRPAS